MVYETPNYYKNFVGSHPDYNLSLGEFDILKATTQLVPRLLEQSLITELSPAFNKGTEVLYQYNQFSVNDSGVLSTLDLYNYANDGSKPLEIRDKLTGLLLRPQVTSMNLACEILKISRNTCNRYINLAQGFYSKVFGRTVTIG